MSFRSCCSNAPARRSASSHPPHYATLSPPSSACLVCRFALHSSPRRPSTPPMPGSSGELAPLPVLRAPLVPAVLWLSRSRSRNRKQRTLEPKWNRVWGCAGLVENAGHHRHRTTCRFQAAQGGCAIRPPLQKRSGRTHSVPCSPCRACRGGARCTGCRGAQGTFLSGAQYA